MTQEQKQLLLKDLCARLPYGLVINIGDEDLKLDRHHQGIGILYPEDCSDEFNERHNNSAFYITISGCYYGEDIKPYLRPMSSMSTEEIEEYIRLRHKDCIDIEKPAHCCKNSITAVVVTLTSKETVRYWYNDMVYVDTIDFLYFRHFDFRGLIPMELALEAPEDMYDLN